MNRLYYYPGCSLEATAAFFDRSVRATARVLDWELLEMPDWNCCGSAAAHVLPREEALLAAARNFFLLSEPFDILAPCASCFNRLKQAELRLAEDAEFRKRAEAEFGALRAGRVASVIHLVDFYSRSVGLAVLRAAVRHALPPQNMVAYYGCLLTRVPGAKRTAEREHPQDMEAILKALGLAPRDWSFQTECCGASLAVADPAIQLRLTRRLLDEARAVGAAALVTACPMCHFNLDSGGWKLGRQDPGFRPLPIYLLSQLVGRALGLKEKDLGVAKHFVREISR